MPSASSKDFNWGFRVVMQCVVLLSGWFEGFHKVV